MNNGKKFDFLHFLHLAYTEYNKHVKQNGYVYSRFYKDFLNGHRNPVMGEDVNEHERIMGSLTELFTNRRILVEHYFGQDRLEDADFMALLQAHNTTEAGKHPIETKVKIKSAISSSNKKPLTALAVSPIDIHMNATQLRKVADWICGRGSDGKTTNENFIVGNLDGNGLLQFLRGERKIKIRKGKNQMLLLLLDALGLANMISGNWRPFFENKRNLISASNHLPLTVNQMYRSLSGAKQKYFDKSSDYFEKAHRIASEK